jgi:hypothetical protein
MYTLINEPIEVFANFTFGGLIPIIFAWRNKDYNIQAINFMYTEQKGTTKLFYFNVSNNSENYKLCLNSSTLTWELVEIYSTTKYSRAPSINDAPSKLADDVPTKTKIHTAYRLR